MPTPVSRTDTSTKPSFGVAATSIRPPSGLMTDLSLVRLNLAQPLVNAQVEGDAPSSRPLTDQGQGAVEWRGLPRGVNILRILFLLLVELTEHLLR